MPALLTAAIIVCGSLKSPGAALHCQANVYHGLYTELETCAASAASEAIDWETRLATDGRATNTRSYAECYSKADEDSVTLMLPEFMQKKMDAKGWIIRHYDVRDGNIVERKVSVKGVKL